MVRTQISDISTILFINNLIIILLTCVCFHTSRQGCKCLDFCFSQLHHSDWTRTETNSKDTRKARIPQKVPNIYSCVNKKLITTIKGSGNLVTEMAERSYTTVEVLYRQINVCVHVHAPYLYWQKDRGTAMYIVAFH